MKEIKNTIWLFLCVLAEYFSPLQFVEAKGGFFGGPIFSIILTVAFAAVSFGALAPLGISGGLIQGAITNIAADIGISATTAADIVTAYNVVSGVYDLVSLGTSSLCLSGTNSYAFGGCHGSSGGSPAPNTQAAVAANTETKQLQPGPTYTCPDGYTLDPDSKQCIADGYISCASAGHPELVCPSNTSCTNNGQCQGSTVSGGSCSADSGSACSSAANSCGMTNQATYECNGSCPASTPSDSSCVAPTISISEEPSLVNPGNMCTVSWTVQNATSCTLSSNGSDTGLPESAALPSGNYNSKPLTAATTYTLSCMNGKIVSSQLSVTCHINPQFNEI